MLWKLVRLTFGSNLAHFGELGIGMEETSERVRSDTLFSAWISSYSRLFGKDEVGQLLDRFAEKPQLAFRISSTFIYYKDKKRYIYYLPKPLALPRGYRQEDDEDDDLDFAKTYQKLSYLPLEIWQRWYQTEEGFTQNDKDELIKKTQNKSVKNGQLYNTQTFRYNEKFKICLVPKVAVDRNTRATNFYHIGFVQFLSKPEKQQQAGLYFLVYFPDNFDQKIQQNLELALRVLGEEGLGGERSSGAGRFEAEWLELNNTGAEWEEILNFHTGNHQCLISLFWQDKLPSELLDNNLMAEGSNYVILERSGWVASPFSGRQLRRKSIRMFAEGSVFPLKSSEQTLVAGELANVTPDEFKTPEGVYKPHKIYRSGFSISLPINIVE